MREQQQIHGPRRLQVGGPAWAMYTGIMNRPAIVSRIPHSSVGGNSRSAILPIMKLADHRKTISAISAYRIVCEPLECGMRPVTAATPTAASSPFHDSSPHKTRTATTMPAIASSVPAATCRCRRWPSSCATTPRSSSRGTSSSSVSKRTSLRVGPRPETYALCLRVRRLASETRIVRTGTPARRESSCSSPASSRSGSGQNRLKSRSNSSGARTLKNSTNKAAPGAATAGHQPLHARTEPSSSTSARLETATPMTSPFALSESQPRNVCVENPQRRS